MNSEYEITEIEERTKKPFSGMIVLVTIILLNLASIAGIVVGAITDIPVLAIVGSVVICLLFFIYSGLKVINPNEALVLTLFGKYYGTIKEAGFFFVHPFATARNPVAEKNNVGAAEDSLKEMSGIHEKTHGVKKIVVSKKVSTKVLTFNNGTQKVNDAMGNPIIIGAVVVWKVKNPTKAVFNVDDYFQYLSTQCDSTIRNVARLYPYDIMEEGESDEKTLRGSSQEIAEGMKVKLQERVVEAGLEILEVRITHLSYAEEIAAAMLQRQQAAAIIAARQKIVAGAVGMVKSALEQLGEENIVVLDEERKATMVSNLLVVLCANKDAQPIVNSGSIY